MTALQYFRLFAKEFASVSDADVNTWLGVAAQDVYAPCLNDEELARATALMAAHLLKQSTDTESGYSGTIKTEKEGDLSRTYADSVSASSYAGGTAYWDQYMALTSRCFGASIMTRM